MLRAAVTVFELLFKLVNFLVQNSNFFLVLSVQSVDVLFVFVGQRLQGDTLYFCSFSRRLFLDPTLKLPGALAAELSLLVLFGSGLFLLKLLLGLALAGLQQVCLTYFLAFFS